MMEASGMKKTETDRFTDTVFSWSLEDILDENLYKNQVEEIPKSFESVQHYFGSIYSLCWRKLEFKCILVWKLFTEHHFAEAVAKPETVSDLQRVGTSWAFVSVTKVSENENEEDGTSLYFKVKASTEFEDKSSARKSLFSVFFVNLIPTGGIWKSLNMSGNLKIIKEVVCTDFVAQENYHLRSETNDDIWDKWLLAGSLSAGLDECNRFEHCICEYFFPLMRNTRRM